MTHSQTSEAEVYAVTERMNDRGIKVDPDLTARLMFFVRDAAADIDRNLEKLTDGAVKKATKRNDLIKWLQDRGIEPVDTKTGKYSVGKWVVNALIDDPETDEKIRQVCLYRRWGGKSSTSKFKGIMNRLNRDSRIRGSLLYAGAAATRRWSSRGAQLQNLPGAKQLEHNIRDAVDLMLTGPSLEEVSQRFGPPMIVASELVRPIFVAEDGHWLARGDLSQIEARMAALLAGEEPRVQAFRDYDTIIGYDEKGEPIRKGPDIYKVTAANIIGTSIDSVNDSQRKEYGKVPELACIASDQLVLTDHGLIPIQDVTTDMRVWDGEEWVFHEGVVFRGYRDCIEYDGLIATEDHQVFVEDFAGTVPFGFAAERGLQLQKISGYRALNPNGETRRPVWDILNAGPRNRFTVSGRLVHNCGYGGGKGAFQSFARLYNVKVTDERADEIKQQWRDSNPNIVQMWWDLENAAIQCMESDPGAVIQVRDNIHFTRNNVAMVMVMPSGNRLIFWYPELVEKEKRGRLRPTVTYYAQDSQTFQWKPFDAYGGIYFAMLCQSSARDLIARSLVFAEQRGLNPVLTVHDEIVCEIPRSMYRTADAAAAAVNEIMTDLPDWADGLPIAADCSADMRYLKS